MILNYSDTQNGHDPIVLLHGMAGSIRYWKNFLPYIDHGRRVIAIDLLGFGHSPMPRDVTYNYETHIQSILETLEHIGLSSPFTLVGHSMGGLLALRLAATHPQQIQKLILIAMPIYTTANQAHQALVGDSKLKQWAYYGLSSRILCNFWCRYLRPVSSRVAPLYLPHLTHEAARDSVLHSWQAYAQSLQNVIEHQYVASDVNGFKKPIVLIYGDQDLPAALQTLPSYVTHKNYEIIILSGTHQIINEQPQKIANFL